MSNTTRPVSPHLSIYRPQITSVLSIAHRITGVFLYLGLVPLITFLVTVAYFPEHYTKLYECFSSVLGMVFLFCWTLAFYYHLFNGIRHLYWDMGKGFDIPTVTKTGWFAIVFSIISSIVTWVMAFQNAVVL